MAKTTAEKIAVMTAFEEGKEIEHIWHPDQDSTWSATTTPKWDWWQYDYRIKPQPAPIPMTIPWEAIDEKWQWAAMDADGEVYLYSEQPCKSEWWEGGSGIYCNADCLKINKGSVSWENSLQQRPQA